jgi:putative hydrolase of the HAD superfamily
VCFQQTKLGARKPDPGFYHAVLRECSYAASEVVMVGDNYQADVVGAKQAGLRAIWYNPAVSPCPINSSLHDAEIRTMSELLATLGKLILHEMDGC